MITCLDLKKKIFDPPWLRDYVFEEKKFGTILDVITVIGVIGVNGVIDGLTLLTWTRILKNLPDLLNNQKSDLIHLVKTELGVDNLKLCGKVNFRGDNFPILDALSCKLGLSLRHLLAPPTSSCLLCAKPLSPNHKPVQVPLHSVDGPWIASKYSWECRSCRGAGQFLAGQSGCFNFLILWHFHSSPKSF